MTLLTPRRLCVGLCAGLSVLLTLPLVATATVAPTETDARKIMAAVEDRERGDKGTSTMKMVITDGSGRKRERVVQSRSMDFAGGTKQLLIFESPGDVANTGLLSVDYDDGAKDDDQWLYLPSLRKSTRISSGDKSGSFMGSDLTYADMTQSDPDDYAMIDADGTVGGEAVWVIEAKPRTPKAKKETGYAKTRVWISKEKLMPLQTKMWVVEGRKIKQMKFSGIKKIDGIWTATKISARTLKGKDVESTTVLSFSKMTFDDPSVKESDFTQRRLEKGL